MKQQRKNPSILGGVALGLLVASCLCVPSAFAADQTKTFQVAIRSVGFAEGVSGAATVGVVFDPAIGDSVSAKDAIVALDGGTQKAGKVTVTVKPVAIGELSGTSGLDALYITPGLSGQYGAIQSYANTNKVISIGGEMDCVKAGKCVVGTETDPTIQVYINGSAASAAGVSFQSAFKMMVKEL